MIHALFTICTLCFAMVCYGSGADSLPTHNIDSIVVKSYRFDMKLKDVPNKVEVITRKDIGGHSSINIADIIKKSVSCEAVDMQGLASAIEFRGFTPSSMGVNKYSVMLVDGVPMGTKNAAATTLFFLSGIEIFKGPFSSLYGSGAMGGFINMITPQTKGRLRGAAELNYGSYNTFTGAVSIGGNITKGLDFDLALSYFDRNNNYKTGSNSLLHTTDYERKVLDDNAKDAIYNNTTLDKTNAILRLGYDFKGGWRLNLYNDLYYTGSAPSNNMLWGMDGQTSARDVLRNYHRADLTTTLGNHSLRLSPYFSRESSTDKYVSKYGNTSGENHYTTYGFQLQDAMRITTWMQLAVGVDNFTQRYISRLYDAQAEAISPWQPDYMNSQTGVFTQIHINVLDEKLSAIAGLRYDNTLFKTYKTPQMTNTNATKNYNTLNPNIAIKYKITPLLNAHTSLGTAFLAPDAFMTTGQYQTYTLIKGNPNLKPEKSLSYDFGIGYISKNRALQADATIFITEYKNKIISESTTEYTTYNNSEQSSIRGYETMLSYDLGRALAASFSLNFYGNYTRIFRAELNSKQHRNPVRYLSKNNSTAGVDFTYKRISARFSGRYIGSKINDNYIYDFDPKTYTQIPFTTTSGVVVRPSLVNNPLIDMPDFIICDINAGYNFAHSFGLNFKVENIFNELYAERDGFYMPGRNFSIQISARF